MSQWSNCGDGSFCLIDVTSYLVAKHNPNVFVTKLQREHGGINFECSINDEYIIGARMAAETLSNYLCEICGAPGIEDQHGFDGIKCRDHASDQHHFMENDFLDIECLRDKPAWSRNISIFSSLVSWEVNNKRCSKFRVTIDRNKQIAVRFSVKTDFTQGITDVFVNYCNRIDAESGKILCNQPPLRNSKSI